MSDSGATTPPRAKLTACITCFPVEVDGLPLYYQPSFAIDVGPFGSAEVQKALADSQIISALLREHPEEMAAIVNAMLAGRTDVARQAAFRIGLTEAAFQQQGGGMLWWLAIAFVGGAIFGLAATSAP
jgi:hypothetical protein